MQPRGLQSARGPHPGPASAGPLLADAEGPEARCRRPPALPGGPGFPQTLSPAGSPGSTGTVQLPA
eukprot:10602546-Alexandrium_andersonii.AAC.1